MVLFLHHTFYVIAQFSVINKQDNIFYVLTNVCRYHDVYIHIERRSLLGPDPDGILETDNNLERKISLITVMATDILSY